MEDSPQGAWSRMWADRDMAEPQVVYPGTGEVVVFTRGWSQGDNQDAVAVRGCDDGSLLLAVADGAGGLPSGAAAAAIAIQHVAAIAQESAAGDSLRSAVLSAFDGANDAIQALGSGAACTLAIAEISDGLVRSYHAGDSVILVTGQRGRIKLLTMAHSPVGYAQEAGVITEDEALQHDERHLVSNMLGSPSMRIEVGPPVALSPRDTLVIGSDGLFDNLTTAEVVECVRTGPLARTASALVTAATDRMHDPPAGAPSKPDDLGFVLYRPRPRG